MSPIPSMLIHSGQASALMPSAPARTKTHNAWIADFIHFIRRACIAFVPLTLEMPRSLRNIPAPMAAELHTANPYGLCVNAERVSFLLSRRVGTTCPLWMTSGC